MAKTKLRMIFRDKDTMITDIIEANRAYFFRKDGSFTNSIKRVIKKNVEEEGHFKLETTTLLED